MTPPDTGPLVALVDTGDDYNAACEAQLPLLSLPLVSPWPCFTEAMHLLNRAGGGATQDELWENVGNVFPFLAAFRRSPVPKGHFAFP